MIRRKAKEYSGSSLELGGAADLTKHVPMKKLKSMKAVKYIILIMLGFILHAGYRFLTKPNSQGDIIDISPDDIVNSEAPSNNDWEDEKNPFIEELEQESKVREKLGDHAKQVFDSHRTKNTVSVKIEKDSDKHNIVKTDEHMKKQNKPTEKAGKQPPDSYHLNKQIKDNIVEKKFNPRNDNERKDLKKEMEIENQIAKLMDDNQDSQKLDQMPVEDYKDPEKPIQKDPEVQQEFHQKAEQIAQVVNSNIQSFVLSEGHHTHDIPALVTAVSQQTLSQIEHLVTSIQYFYPKEDIYVFDLDLNDDQRLKLSSFCNVRMRGFWLNLFPSFIHDLSNFYWRPLIIQTALAEFGHIAWINPGFKVSSMAFNDLVHKSEEPGILVIGQNADYSTFAVTHPKMYKYLTVDRRELFKSPHIEMRAMIIHNTDEVMNNFMKLLTACAVEEQCLSPPGAASKCRFDVTGREYADCHRYDESAVNIILKNWLGHKSATYMVKSNFLQPINKYDRANPKICRT
ncbi:uncharacterized protein LOC133201181 [Saccostrea echinata]|uniref:uncharacterized protein LOC133201181 n=1 Tax=Saccostrea echinata TaxID=191078 RepID=UPI002A80CC82|nr:uncharacterized protein LOC133201181 [Saccostrea echinata]